MLPVAKIPGAQIVVVKDYQEKIQVKSFAILDGPVCLGYKSGLYSSSKAQPGSAAPGLGIGVHRDGFDHQLPSVSFGLFLSPSCIPYIFLTASALISRLCVHEDPEDAGRLLSCLD